MSEWNYWKCKVTKRHALKRKWIVTIIETGQVVCKAKKWKVAVRFAVEFAFRKALEIAKQ